MPETVTAPPAPAPLRRVSGVYASAWWNGAAVVIELVCGHRHVRPLALAPSAGDTFPCIACGDEKES